MTKLPKITHLKECCNDLLMWHATGILPEGEFRKFASKMPFEFESERLRLAESLVSAAALAFTVLEYGKGK